MSRDTVRARRRNRLTQPNINVQPGFLEDPNMGDGLRGVLSEAQAKRSAVGHFNVSDIAILKAVTSAARDMKTAVIVGASEGERTYLGTRQIAAVIHSLRGEIDVPIFLNADHTHSLASALEAAKAGFDSIVFDISSLPFEENVKQTRQAVQALKDINPAILIEGEIGDIGTGSEIHETASVTDGALTTADEARQFVQATGVDALAPAIGNRHGMSRSMVEGASHKHLNLARIAEIKAAAGCFLTLHGGSGTGDTDFVGAIRAGINIIHVNTELRVAWRRGLEKGLAADSSEVVPYKILPQAIAAVEDVVKSRLRLFSGAS
jgi:fructose-bisphosphate aldolase class II